jgi:hypothetical protein
VARLGAELVANRLRTGHPLRLLLTAGGANDALLTALAVHMTDGSLPTGHAEVDWIDRPGDAPRQDDADRRVAALGLGRPVGERPVDLAAVSLGRDGGLGDGVRGEAMHALWHACAIVLLAIGSERAAALHAMLERPPSPLCPASLLRDHPRLIVLADREAARDLRPAPAWTSDRALVVLGHREPGISPEHRISDESRARLRHGADIARDSPVRAAVLTGWTRAGGLSEAEQMLTAWDDPDTPALLEVAGRDTAENATRSLPLLLATGAIRRVTVVTSAWHVRAHWYFAPYRQYGLALDFAPVVTPRSRWGPMIVNELRQIPAAPRIRRERYAAMRLPRRGP